MGVSGTPQDLLTDLDVSFPFMFVELWKMMQKSWLFPLGFKGAIIKIFVSVWINSLNQNLYTLAEQTDTENTFFLNSGDLNGEFNGEIQSLMG